ncbi:RDD family protein [Actomonas aquatica]|uniref:RDD family protein n=1 Tax=Actomonas aquatica TaxID=2866162 RepID=A0ABZ1CDN4_9BACT|nr:RDD family protein [Opitutus sp. WL0086]WRQ89789.1 RDD family protein [Opitutus sp. WL0086]
MKLLRILSSLTGAGLALGLSLALRLPAQTPVEEPTPANPTEEVAPPPESTDDAERPLRELGVGEPAAEADEAADEELDSNVVVAVEIGDNESDDDEDGTVIVTRSHRSNSEKVSVGSDVDLEADEETGDLVAVMGNAIVEGIVRGDTVVILGDLTLNGHSQGDTVNVLGNLTLNGEADRDVVAVLSSVQLGPEAHVHGDFISVGGQIQRAPGARIDGDVREIPFLGTTHVNFEWLKAWVQKCLVYGRPLWFGENLGWVWMLVGTALVFYILIALIVPKPVKACARTMEKHPGFSLLTAVLSVLLVPLLMIVLAVTGIGPLVLGLLMFFVGIFGKVVFLAWLGRRFHGDPDRMAAPVAVLIGGLLTIVIYLVPVLGFVFQKLSGFLGSGIVIYTMILAMQGDRQKGSSGGSGAPAAQPVPPPVEPAAGATEPAAAATANVTPAPSMTGPRSTLDPESTAPESAAESAPPPPMPPPMPPPPMPSGATMGGAARMQFSTLPRAGFWARLGATLIDIILLAIVLNVIETRFFHATEYFFLLAGVYHVVMWGLKGTTVGGIVLGLKVVRLDDRPMDWSIAIVRGLGSYISLVVIGLGFAWVAFDPERQSWHDKIAGTTIVRVPKGISLI